MFKREKAPEIITPLEPELLGRQLMRSFYISFALSQGLVAPQDKLLSLSTAYYQSIYGRQLTTEASETISQDFIENLNIPHNHKPIDDAGVAAEFSNRWKDYKLHINRPHRLYSPEVNSYQTRLADVMGDIATADLRFLEPKIEDAEPNQLGRGRPNKKDPYKSYFREHVLVGSSTGDPNAFDPILADAANLLKPDAKLTASNKIKVLKLQNYSLPRLAHSWENSHPGREFADAEQITSPTSLRIARLASDLTKQSQ